MDVTNNTFNLCLEEELFKNKEMHFVLETATDFAGIVSLAVFSDFHTIGSLENQTNFVSDLEFYLILLPNYMHFHL